MHSTETTASQTFSNFFGRLSLGDIPADALHRAKLHLLDTLGAGIAGSASAEVQASRRALASAAGVAPEGKGTPLWGTPGLVPPLQAAFVNGVASHAFELDDSGGCDHSGAVVVPAALAAASMAEAGEPVTGERLLIAITAGYELGRRVQTALGGYDQVNNAGWHSTGVCGTLAAAAATGIVLNLSPVQLTSAIGLAGSFTGGTWAFMSDGSMSKRLHVGRAAEAGLNSALLARAGFTGPADIFSAPWGSFLKLYGGSAADESAIYEGLGGSWLVERSSIKPYASCRSTHSAIDAVLFLKEEHRISPESVERVTVHTSSLIFDMCGGRDVSSLVAAQLSMPFALATAMLHHRMALQDVALEGRTDPALAALMERIELRVDASQHGGSAEPCIEIRSGGQVYRRQAVTARGASTNRLSDADTLSKFADLAGTRLPPEQVAQLTGNVLALESLPDVEVLNRLLGTAGEPALIR